MNQLFEKPEKPAFLGNVELPVGQVVEERLGRCGVLDRAWAKHVLRNIGRQQSSVLDVRLQPEQVLQGDFLVEVVVVGGL